MKMLINVLVIILFGVSITSLAKHIAEPSDTRSIVLLINSDNLDWTNLKFVGSRSLIYP